MKRKVLVSFLVSVGLTCSNAPPVAAAMITIELTAVVAIVQDPEGTLGGAILPGQTITGSYTYESTTPDSNALTSVGDYWHSSPLHWIALFAGGWQFRSDPRNPSLLVEITNDHNGRDNYLIRSYNNISTGPPVDHIAWQLDDPTAAALSSTALPSTAPVLADWQSNFGLTITGPGFPGFLIRAHVTSAIVSQPVPIPAVSDWGRAALMLVLLATGAAALAKRSGATLGGLITQR